MKKYPESELIINSDGSCFHLHLKPEYLADKVILVGDPGRVSLVASYFDKVEHETGDREFRTVTGIYKDKRITVQSTGIGCDNIDIVLNELDALANINFETRTDHPRHRTLDIVRIGTCGGLQPDTPLGSVITSVKSIGFDGLLNYYADRDRVCDLGLEEAFTAHMDWDKKKGAPYVASADKDLTDRIAGDEMIKGITCSCGGFYGPQGRQLRLGIQDPEQNHKIEAFRYTMPQDMPYGGMNLKICNFEMESSALAGLASMLGHKATTCCLVIANRYQQEMNTSYKGNMADLIKMVIDRI